MFERFTDGARRSVVLAQDEARLLGHSYIGSEHLLLGLASVGTGAAAPALDEVGVSLEAARAEIERLVGRGRETDDDETHLPFTPRAKKVIELALREGLDLGDRSVATEHLLLAIVREGGGVAMQVLTGLGVQRDQLRAAVLRHRTPDPAGPVAREPSAPGDDRISQIEESLQLVLREQRAIMRALDEVLARLPPPTTSRRSSDQRG